MLTNIQIRNFTIIDALELDLEAGMTAMTGETGAGKSILVDALGLVLGDRASAELVRPGADKAEIIASFDLGNNPEAGQWLEQHDLEMDGACLLRRVIKKDGRTKGYINGRQCPLQQLRRLGEMLVDIHGQHEHQLLLRQDKQRELLDAYGDDEKLSSEVGHAYRQWRETQRRLQELQQAGEERQDRIDLLRYQLAELQELDLGTEELQDINEDHVRLSNAEKLIGTVRGALDQVYENDELSLYGQLGHLVSDIESLVEVDAGLSPILELLTGAQIQLQEAADGMRRYADSLDLDPNRLAWLEQRLADIHDIARKHRIAPEEIPALTERMHQEVQSLEQQEDDLSALGRQVQDLEAGYRQVAERLSRHRQHVAERLSEKVSEAIRGLGMPQGRFSILVQPTREPAEHGMDTIDYQVTTNPGQPLRGLGKVASGGELSRISLAIRMITAFNGQVGTLVFDEVDTGIGGGVAEVVGRHLQSLGRERQVLCVTHLPQVASQAHRHYHVSKQQEETSTRTQIRDLPRQQRVEELARMLGGMEITPQTRAHAEEMLQRAGH